MSRIIKRWCLSKNWCLVPFNNNAASNIVQNLCQDLPSKTLLNTKEQRTRQRSSWWASRRWWLLGHTSRPSDPGTTWTRRPDRKSLRQGERVGRRRPGSAPACHPEKRADERGLFQGRDSQFLHNWRNPNLNTTQLRTTVEVAVWLPNKRVQGSGHKSRLS